MKTFVIVNNVLFVFFELTMKFIQSLRSEIVFECRNLLLQVGSSVWRIISDSMNLNLRLKKKWVHVDLQDETSVYV